MAEKATVHVDYKASGLQTLSQAGNLITGINQGLQLMRTGFTALTAVTKTFIATGSQFERYEVQFTTLLGSIEAARDRMKELTTFAMETPFDLPGVVEAAQKLEAYGVYAESTLRTVGDAAAAMGKTLEQGVEAIADASRGELERLKEFGISAAELTERMGHQLNRATVEGLEEIQDTVLAIMGERYGGGMQALSQTLAGTISNLRGYWIEFKKEVADTEAFQAAKDIFGAILDTVRQLFDQGYVQNVATIMGETISRALLGATLVMAHAAAGIWKITDAVGGIVGGVSSMVGSISRGPVGKVMRFGSHYRESREAIEAELAQTAVPIDDKYKIIWDLIATLETAYGAIGASRFVGPEWEPEWWEGAGGTGGRGAGGGARGSAAMPVSPFDTSGAAAGAALGMWDEEQMTEAAGIMDRHKEDQLATISILTTSWESHYARISQAAFKWGQGEGRVIKDIYRMTKMSLAASLQDVVHYLTQKAAMKRLEQIAEMIGEGASFNFWSAAQHAAAALAWGTLGGVAGGMIGGWAAEPEPDFGTVGEGGAGAPPESRTISRGVGVKAQNITINIHVGHYGATVYGDGGIRQLWEEHLEPLIEQSFAMGRI